MGTATSRNDLIRNASMKRRSFIAACMALIAALLGAKAGKATPPKALTKLDEVRILNTFEHLVIRHNATAEDLLAWARLGGRMQDRGIKARFAGRVFSLLWQKGMPA